MTAREIRKQIRELKAEMKALGIKRFSCFMPGHTGQSYRCNAKLFELDVQLKQALEQEQQTKGGNLTLPPHFWDN